MDTTITHSKHKKCTENYLKLWSLMFFIFLIYTFAVCINYEELLLLCLFLTSYSLINGTFGSASTVYSFFILSVKARFEALNNCLR